MKFSLRREFNGRSVLTNKATFALESIFFPEASDTRFLQSLHADLGRGTFPYFALKSGFLQLRVKSSGY